jgi:N-methylhydantoinase B
MRLSAEGFYIERYVKCANCGLLMYDDGVASPDARDFCSDWCVQWDAKRQAGERHPVLPLGTRVT